MLRNVLLYTMRSFLTFTIVTTIGGAIHFFVIEPSEVNGRSMENTFIDRDIILIDKISLLITQPKRGQVISVFDEYEDLLMVKRIIGLPGEQVIIKNGSVFLISVDGELNELEEPYIKAAKTTLPQTGLEAHYGIIGPNEYFLLGDNRAKSTDSRRYGTVHRSQIVGLIR